MITPFNSLPHLKLVPGDHVSQAEIADQIQDLLDALAAVQVSDPALRQLWLETHWLKDDYEQGVLAVPTNWELLIFQIANNEVGDKFARYPAITAAATTLAMTIQARLQ